MTAHATIRHVEIVIPARDEAALIPATLASVRRAMATVHGPRVGVTVVADRSRDATSALAAQAGATVLRCDAGAVGPARDAGCRAALAACAARGVAPAQVWLACTDADTLVPAQWLVRQLHFADAGADAVLGTVAPAEPRPLVRSAWRRRQHLAEGHPHIHGANLGVRGSAYEAVGGFGAHVLGEDVRLARRLQETGRRWVATDTTRVLTSARRQSRVTGGFADYLAGLEALLRSPAAPPEAPPGSAPSRRPVEHPLLRDDRADDASYVRSQEATARTP